MRSIIPVQNDWTHSCLSRILYCILWHMWAPHPGHFQGFFSALSHTTECALSLLLTNNVIFNVSDSQRDDTRADAPKGQAVQIRHSCTADCSGRWGLVCPFSNIRGRWRFHLETVDTSKGSRSMLQGLPPSACLLSSGVTCLANAAETCVWHCHQVGHSQQQFLLL